jgi:hypothetical protein
MKPLFAAGLLLACAACSDSELEISAVQTGDGKPPSLVEIYTPNSGDTLPADTPFTLEFAVVRGGGGDYVEVQVDKKKPVKVAHTRGHHLVPGLPPGPHTIAVKEFDQHGQPTGGRTSVTITVK